MNKVSRKKNDNFTVISNVFLRDKNLSLKSKGFLSVVMGLPDNWDFTINGICAILKEGKTAVYSTINELKDNGYCIANVIRNDKGVFIGYDYDFFEEPNTCTPNLESPHTDNPHTDNQTQLNTNRINNANNKINNNKEDTNVSKKAKIDWRGDIEVYREECDKAVEIVFADKDCEAGLRKRYPNMDYYRTILKSVDFWKSEKGWGYKKNSKSRNINMATTIKNNLDKNIVYEDRRNEPIQNKRLLSIRFADEEEGTLVDGTIFKNSHRYYFSSNKGKTVSIPVDAPEMPDDRFEYDMKKGWYLPEEKETLEDMLW